MLGKMYGIRTNSGGSRTDGNTDSPLELQGLVHVDIGSMITNGRELIYYFYFNSKFLTAASTSGCCEIQCFYNHSLEEFEKKNSLFQRGEKKKSHPEEPGTCILGKDYY